MVVLQHSLDRSLPQADGANSPGRTIATLEWAEPADVAHVFRLCAELKSKNWRPALVFHHEGLLRAALNAATPGSVAIAVIRDDNHIRTIWPLRVERRHGLKLAVDLAAPVVQYTDVIGEPLDDATLRMVGRRLRQDFGADVILCRGIRRDSGLACLLSQAGDGVDNESASPFVDLRFYQSFDEYCRRFSKQTIRTRKQRRRKLETQHGPLDFAVLEGPAAREAVATALHWKRQWLNANALPSRALCNNARHERLLAAVDSPGVHVSILSLGKRPVAVELGFSSDEHYAAYLGAFDPAFAHFSPGQEQMLLTLEWCFARGFARYDLLPPRDAYKLHWTRPGDEAPVSDHCVALSPVGALYGLARRYARTPLKRTVLALPTKARVAVRRYGPAAVGVGATAATIGILAD